MRRIALIGMPNTGKSTFFNRMTGASARVGNWPGITVDLMSARILIGDEMAELIDLPGLYDLRGFSDDEKVVRHFLENQPVDMAVVIVNACQLERQLSIFMQVKNLGIPCVLLMNMSDEARRLGIRIDCEKIAALLDVPVVLMSAKYGDQQIQAMQAIRQTLAVAKPIDLATIRSVLATETQIEASVEAILGEAVTIPITMPRQVTDRLDAWLLHPILGLPLFFFALFVIFNCVFLIGGPLQEGTEWLLDLIKTHVVAPPFESAPKFISGLFIGGIWDGVATVATFVPIIVVFFFFMAIVEDTGYLSRAAFIMDTFMARLGLDGRGFVLFLLGFGCNVPSAMGSRVIRSRPMRLLSMLTIPFSLCSARLQVFLFIITALFSPRQAPAVLVSLYMFSFAAAILTALLFKRRYRSDEPFVLELPPYRLPSLRPVLIRGWLEVRHFLRRATKIIISGVVLLWLLTNLPTGVEPSSPQTYAGMLGHALEPFLQPIGIDEKLAIALFFGFVAKEVVISALVVIYGVGEGNDQGLKNHLATQMDWVQAYSFMLFTLIYTPCLAMVATMHSEARNARYTIMTILWSLILAWVVSFIFYQSARALGF